MQLECPSCHKLKQLHQWHGKQCRDCYNQQHPPHASSAAASAAALFSTSPPATLFDRPEGCIDQLTHEQREAIVTLDAIGWLHKDIAKKIPCSDNTVTLWVQRWQDERSLEDRERSGRPRCTDEKTDVCMEEYVEEKKFTVPKEIKRELELDCSVRTIRRRLDEVNLFGRVAEKEYVFDEFDIQRRLSFAQGYANWTEEDWSRVIFSDETHIEVYGRSRVWVQRPPGKAFDPQYIAQHMPHSERVSLWGCFCSKGIGQAEIFTGEFKAPKYVGILQHNLIQTALHFYPKEHWWLQQDNAPQHRSQLASIWFHNHGVDRIDFPPYSPDLNPIENIWGIVKSQVEQRLVHTIEEVEQVLKQVWEALDTSLLAKLIASMPARCQAVIANKGHKTPY